MKFRITVVQVVKTLRTVEVEADDEEQAEDLALDEVRRDAWEDFEVMSTEELIA